MAWIARRMGQRGERLAAQYLRRKGYRIIAKNFHTRRGEIDLVCADGDGLVFVEVKARSADSLGFPEDAVGLQKRQRLLQAVNQYLAQLREPPPHYRLDVVSIQQRPDGGDEIVHYQNVTA